MPIFKTSKSRENILSRIRKSLNDQHLPIPFPESEKESAAVYAPTDLSAEEQFADEFIKVGGKFVFCADRNELAHNIVMLHEARNWRKMLCADRRLLITINNNMPVADSAEQAVEDADACITGCEALLARTGSIVLSSMQQQGRVAPVYYPVHIVVAYINQICTDIDDALAMLKKKYRDELPSMINVNTGPSRTADIEKTLVVGVHGPKEVFCFLVNEESY